jgi:DUF1680 family protein
MLTPVHIQNVRFGPGFLGDRVRINREITLPIEYQQCKRTGRLDAWKWKPGQPNPPHQFWDSDVAKWIEAAAYSLAAEPDPELEAKIDAVVDLMAKGQEDDGYLNSHFSLVEPDKRWTNLRDMHELYCAGHLMEAAVAYHGATGKRTLLDVMCRYADHIDAVFGPNEGQKRGYPGHEEIELALVKMYRATGEKRYARLAAFFVNERGTQPHYFDRETRERGQDPASYYGGNYDYTQAHLPVREQTAAEGHAVRAAYLYAGMADVAAETADAELLDACRTIWQNITRRRMYITGGIGSTHHGERFTVDYDLPNETAYTETCAAIALVFFAHRMLQIEPDADYADVMERAIYNGVLSGISLRGTEFFYANPLTVYPHAHGFGRQRFPVERQEWFGCSCCPPNIARLLASLGKYVYSTAPGEIWVHLFSAGSLSVELEGTPVRLEQHTTYPWDETVELALGLNAPAEFTLAVRIPGWVRDPQLMVNGRMETLDGRVRNGYARFRRTWNDGDTVQLIFPMPVERVVANPHVRQICGRVALQRGPVVYCLEEIDNGPDLAAIALPEDETFDVTREGSPFSGVPVIRGPAKRLDHNGWDDELYRAGAGAKNQPRDTAITAVPYCLWANRTVGEMMVWLREATA